MEFIEWSVLATVAGAVSAVLLITQLIKDLKLFRTIPTQILSYGIALAVLYPAYLFTGQLSLSNAVLILFHGIVVALTANGGFDAVKRVLFRPDGDE